VWSRTRGAAAIGVGRGRGGIPAPRRPPRWTRGAPIAGGRLRGGRARRAAAPASLLRTVHTAAVKASAGRRRGPGAGPGAPPSGARLGPRPAPPLGLMCGWGGGRCRGAPPTPCAPAAAPPMRRHAERRVTAPAAPLPLAAPRRHCARGAAGHPRGERRACAARPLATPARGALPRRGPSPVHTFKSGLSQPHRGVTDASRPSQASRPGARAPPPGTPAPHRRPPRRHRDPLRAPINHPRHPAMALTAGRTLAAEN
jgi:hypothetical protein